MWFGLLSFSKFLQVLKFLIILRLFVGWTKLHGKRTFKFLQLGFVLGVIVRKKNT